MSSSPKILHILSGDLWAGKEYQVVALLTGMKALGHVQSVLLFNEAESAKRCREVGAVVTVIDEEQGFFSLLAKSRKRLAAEIVVAHGYKEALLGLILSRSFGAKLITVHHGMLEDSKRLKPKIYNAVKLFISRFFSNRSVFVSEDLRNVLGFSNNPSTAVIHNALSGEDLVVGPLSSTESGHIVFCGRLVGVKRGDLAIQSFREALPMLPETVNLLVVGDGPEKSNLEDLVRRFNLSDRVRFLGFRMDARSLISSARCLLITSEHEGIPTVMLEAMRATVPVVSTAVGGITEIARLFPDYPIALVPRGDRESISKLLVSFGAAEYESSKGVSPQESERFLSYFSPQRMAGEYLKLISGLL